MIKEIKGVTIKAIYDDDLCKLLSTIAVEEETMRASFVEPVQKDGKTYWVADMCPIKMIALGPFETRAKALEAEREWLRKNVISCRNNPKPL